MQSTGSFVCGELLEPAILTGQIIALDGESIEQSRFQARSLFGCQAMFAAQRQMVGKHRKGSRKEQEHQFSEQTCRG